MNPSPSEFDLVLRNARVLDPSRDLDARLDVSVTNGRITHLAPSLPVSSSTTVEDLAGHYLCPGLIDLHGHWFEGSAFGIDPDLCLNHGVTTAIDAGTTGFINFGAFRKHCIDRSRVRVLAFLNIAACGIPTPLIGELEDLRYARVDDAAECIAASCDAIVGVKVRIGNAMSGSNGAEALRRALDAASQSRVPVMTHISQGADTPAILRTLRPGDILTHCYQGRGDGLLLDDLMLPEAVAARAEGILFDVGHGFGSFHWDTARKAFEHFFYPDTISSDLHRYSIERFCIDLPTTMSKFLHLGMSLHDVIAKTTCAPARALGRGGEIGTLCPGAPADLFAFTLEEGEFILEDTHFNRVTASRRITPRLIVRNGCRIRPGEQPFSLRALQQADKEIL